jgi:hypothetical protein
MTFFAWRWLAVVPLYLYSPGSRPEKSVLVCCLSNGNYGSQIGTGDVRYQDSGDARALHDSTPPECQRQASQEPHNIDQSENYHQRHTAPFQLQSRKFLRSRSCSPFYTLVQVSGQDLRPTDTSQHGLRSESLQTPFPLQSIAALSASL